MPKLYKINSTIWSQHRRWQRVTAYFILITCLFSFGVPNLITPSPVQAATPVVTALKASESFAMALKSDGTVWSWGDNSYGQLGNGSTLGETVPVPVQGLTKVKEIATGPSHALALREDGSVWAWGQNGYGQLGNGTSNSNDIPVQVPGISNVIAIAAGSSHSLALTSDGTVWAWGNNANGRLGDGTTSIRYRPVPISGLTNVVSICAGYCISAYSNFAYPHA